MTEFVENQLIPELSVTDFKRSLDFYTKLLGFTVVFQREEEGFAFLTIGSAQIMIDQQGKGRDWKTADLEYPLGRGINLQITVQSIQPILSSLNEAQVPLFLEVEEKWYRQGDKEAGNKQFLVQDPDGYLLRFTEDLGSRSVTASF